MRGVMIRDEMVEAELRLGGRPIPLIDYATTGLVAVGVAPQGAGKTNAGLLIAEQLSQQGWVCLLIDPEGELESLYGNKAATPEELEARLVQRDVPIVVVPARDAAEFVPFGRVIQKVADWQRKPLFVMIDEGQLFSARRRNSDAVVEATEIVNDLIGRGRKRAVDVFITALRFAGSLQRQVFACKNLTLVGMQEDPASWAALAPHFKASKLEYRDLNELGPGEFICFSRSGTDKIRMPMAEALKAVALKAKVTKRTLPSSFREWTKAVSEIPTQRLEALTPSVNALLGAVAGLPVPQMVSGTRALQDEKDSR